MSIFELKYSKSPLYKMNRKREFREKMKFLPLSLIFIFHPLVSVCQFQGIIRKFMWTNSKKYHKPHTRFTRCQKNYVTMTSTTVLTTLSISMLSQLSFSIILWWLFF